MTKGERIALIRKEESMSQQTFADALLVSRNFIAQVETNKKTISARMEKSICDKFRINPEWLETGEGDMHPPFNREQEIAIITERLYNADPNGMQYRFMKAISELDQEQWKSIQAFIYRLAAEEEGIEDD